MSVENKINFANCRTTQDFLRFSEENSIVDRQSAKDFLNSNKDIPFVIWPSIYFTTSLCKNIFEFDCHHDDFVECPTNMLIYTDIETDKFRIFDAYAREHEIDPSNLEHFLYVISDQDMPAPYVYSELSVYPNRSASVQLFGGVSEDNIFIDFI